MTLTDQQAAELRKPFPKNVTGSLPKPLYKDSKKDKCGECGGYHGLPAVHLEYIGHAATTDRLLSVDPAWSWEPFSVDEQGLPALDRKGNLWIRLTICGVTRIGVGDGMSAKECIGDAIRNAAMRFGVALDLWSKDELEQTSTGAEKLRSNLNGGLAAALAKDDPAPEPKPTAAPTPAPVEGADLIQRNQLSKLQILLKECGVTDRDDALGYYQRVTGRPVESSKALTRNEAGQVLSDLERVKAGEPNLLDPATANDPVNEGTKS